MCLEHSAFFENPEDQDQRNQHKTKYDHPSPSRGAYEVSEGYVHTEETGYQRRRHEKKRNESKDLHDLVLVKVDDTENSILKILKAFETEVCVVYQ